MAARPSPGALERGAHDAAAARQARLRRVWFAPRGPLDTAFRLALWPASQLVGAVAGSRRRRIAQAKAMPRPPGAPPVVVIGNLVVGGTGKTPLLIALAGALAARGWRPGIVARGYGGSAEGGPSRTVRADSDAAEVGDEPVLIARRTGLPVVVGHDRGAALERLRSTESCDVVLSDDGLQHVGLRRDVELAVFDARGAGNGACLPAGPLREPLRDALLLDALVLNGRAASAPIVHSRVFRFEVAPTEWVSLDGTRRWTTARFAAEVAASDEAASAPSASASDAAPSNAPPLTAIAGIAAPRRFFDTLAGLGLRFDAIPLADHAPIDPAWLAALPGRFIVMTEKDAVKCAGFDAALRARCVALRVEAVLETALVDWLEGRLRG